MAYADAPLPLLNGVKIFGINHPHDSNFRSLLSAAIDHRSHSSGPNKNGRDLLLDRFDEYIASRSLGCNRKGER